MPIKLNSAGGGSVTINPANTAATTTLTVPATNANLVTTGDSGTVAPAMLSSGAPSWDSSGNLTTSGTIVSGNATGFRNRIINGAMQIWQRSTSSTSAGYQTVDRWYENASNTTTFSQETSFVPSGFQNAIKLLASSTAIMWIQQPIETKNCYDLQGQTVTVSCYLAASVNTGININLYYSTSADNPASGSWTNLGSAVSVTATSSYVRYTATFTVPSNALTLLPQIVTTTSVASGVAIYITGVQLEAGSKATPFEIRPYGTELTLCQRYFCKNAGPETPVPANGSVYSGPGFSSGSFGTYATTSGYSPWLAFPTAMRATPTISGINTNLVTSPVAGSWSVYTSGSWVNASLTVQQATTMGFCLNVNLSSAGFTAYGSSLWYGAWTASAEL